VATLALCQCTGVAERSALVTGATGFIGSALVPALLAGGWDVRACGRGDRPAWMMDTTVDYRTVDLASGDLGGLLEGVTHVFHLAGASSSLSSVEDMHRSNVIATGRLLAAITRLESDGGTVQDLVP